VRRSRKGTGIGFAKTDDTGAGHDLHGSQAAIRQMASEEPGQGQKYALQERKHIVVLRRVRPDITIEIRWWPAHKGVPRNEKPTNGPSSRWRSQIPAEWHGCYSD